MNATQIGDDYIIDAFRALGVEANATFGELITRLGNLEAKRLHRVSYEATGNSAAGAGQSGIPDGAGEPFDQVTQGAGPALVLQLDKHLAAYGITYDPSGGAPEDWRLDNNQVAIRVILNGEDLVEASAGDLQDGDFYLSAGAAENYLVVRHLHADDTITFELALRRIGEGTPVPEFDLDYDGDDDPSTGTQDGLDYVVPEAVEEAPVV
jgi:hypothetical protein